MNKLNLIYHYFIQEENGRQSPCYQVMKIFDEQGELSSKEIGNAFSHFRGLHYNGYLSFKNEEEMQEFFIEWAQNNKTKQINFYTLTDFNYILQNSNTVQEMQHQLAQYSKKWTPPKSESKSIFQSILN